ncbi:hypothetical protein MNBD_GAMMA03-961 [hydrothermal vent metagenome]|uniref:Uncharacterized protein n=1 Tax=hydrothermal vent metagenome TaxID=652676 RepID=A0A3B0W7S4_9ZZZZ
MASLNSKHKTLKNSKITNIITKYLLQSAVNLYTKQVIYTY